MEFRTRFGLAVLGVLLATLIGFVTLGQGPRLALFLTMVVLAYAYGPVVWNGVPAN
jgi:hypothetical protein